MHNHQPTASLAVWTYIVPPEAMKHALLCGCDSRIRFRERSYRTLPPRPSDNRVLGNLTLSHQHSSGAIDFASDCSAPTGCYRLLYAGDRGISLTRDHQLVPVFQVRSNGAPALPGSYLVDMLHGPTDFSVDQNLVVNGLQQIDALAGTAKLEPGDLLGTFPCPLLRVPVESLLYNNDNASASTPGAPDNSRTFVPGPMTPHAAGLSPTPACTDPFIHNVDEQPLIGRPDAAQPTSADLEPPPSLLDRLNSDQRDSFLQVWHKLPKHLREIVFDFDCSG